MEKTTNNLLNEIITHRLSRELRDRIGTMKRKIICFDLDGTLLDIENKICPEDQKILREIRDVVFIPATGRSYPSIKKLFNKNGLFVDQPIPFPMVTQNGAVLYKEGEQLFRKFTFEPSLQEELIQRILPFEGITFLFFDDEEVYLYSRTPLKEEEAKRFWYFTKLLDSEHYQTPFNKVMCFAEEPVIRKFVQTIQDLPVEGTLSLFDLYEIAPSGVNKAHGIKALLEEMEIQFPIIFAVGDAENDLEMLKMADRSYAPTSALNEALRIANKHINLSEEGLLNPILRELRIYHQ